MGEERKNNKTTKKRISINGIKCVSKKAMETCMPTCENISYMLLNLVGEVGEFSSKIAKGIRKGDFIIKENILYYDPKTQTEVSLYKLDESLMAEAGDILWQLSGLCSIIGWDLEKVAEYNLKKLSERKKNGTIAGNGDGTTKEERL